MDSERKAVARSCKGFMDEEEGQRLFELARDHCALGPVLEIGSYCGKSAVYLGSGVQQAGGVLICVDHHRGSEEHQPGQEYHDRDLFDAESGRMDSLGALRRTLHLARLEDHALILVARSQQAARVWNTPLGMLFIDGGHSFEAAHADFDGWAPKVVPGGVVAIHDLFPDPQTGGQAPIEIYRKGLSSGEFDPLPGTKTLGVLRRKMHA